MRPLIRNHGLPLLLYAAVTALLFWPVALSPMTLIPGAGDAPWFLWDLWWFKHAVYERGVSPFTTDMLYFPLTDVPVVAQTPYNEFLMAPGLFGLPLTLHYNLLVLGSFVLSGYGAYLLVAHLARQRAVALAAGLVFAFVGYRNARALGHLSLLTTQWIPFFFLAAGLLWRRRTLHAGIVLGVMAALTALASPYYAGMVLFPAALVGAPYLLLTRYRQVWDRRLWLGALAAAFVFVALTVPPYLHYLRQEGEMYALARELGEQAAEYSADLLSWLLPSPGHPLWGRWTQPVFDRMTTPNAVETTLFVGLIPLALAVVSFLRIRRLPRGSAYWHALFILTLLLSLGPSLHVAGRAVLPWLPYRLFAQIPGFHLLRIPSRFGITAALCIVVLAALVVAETGASWRPPRRRLVLAAGSALIVANMVWAVPFPTYATAAPPHVALVAQSDSDQALLSLPAGEFHFDDESVGFLDDMARFMQQQTVHQRPLVSGYLARRPARLSVPERTMPFVRRFFSQNPQQRFVALPARQGFPANGWPADILFGSEVLNDLGIKHAALDCAAFDVACRPATVLLTQALGAPISNADGVQLYRTTPTRTTGDPQLIAMAEVAAAGGAAPMALDDYTLGWPLAVAQEFTLTTHLSGTWRVYAELAGVAAPTITVFLDGSPLTPMILSPQNAGTTGEIAYVQEIRVLAPGSHRLEVLCGQSARAAAPCSAGQIANLSARLLNAEIPDPGPALAMFDLGDLGAFSIHAAELYVAREGGGEPLAVWLATVWSAGGKTPRELGGGRTARKPRVRFALSGADPASGSEHRLGQSAVWGDDKTYFLELAPLPPIEGGWQHASLDISLHAPEGAAADPALLTLALGELAQHEVGVQPLPDLPSEVVGFTEPDGAPALSLRGAYIAPAPSCRSQSLVTIWDAPAPLLAGFAEEIVLNIDLLDDEGAQLFEADHRLGAEGVQIPGAATLVETAPLPTAAGAMLRISLWQPAQDIYLTPDDPRREGSAWWPLGSVAELLAANPYPHTCPPPE